MIDVGGALRRPPDGRPFEVPARYSTEKRIGTAKLPGKVYKSLNAVGKKV